MFKNICHSLHRCASAAAKKLPNVVEQFARDTHSYSSHSSKRNDHFKDCQIFTHEKPHKLLYPNQTRWLSLKARPKVPIHLCLSFMIGTLAATHLDSWLFQKIRSRCSFSRIIKTRQIL
jgi:hypothetical protein